VFDNDTDIMSLPAFVGLELMIEGTVILIYVAVGGLALEVMGPVLGMMSILVDAMRLPSVRRHKGTDRRAYLRYLGTECGRAWRD
jgi:hypothetical protein